MSRILCSFALIALMLVGANANGGRNRGSFRCAKTFPGCKTCELTPGEEEGADAVYTCIACKGSRTKFDETYGACMCNSDEDTGYGLLPWPTGKNSGCVVCGNFATADGTLLAASGGMCTI